MYRQNMRNNPGFNSGGDDMGNRDFNPDGNYMGNRDFNPSGNYMGNSDFNSGGNYVGNSDFNSGGNFMGNSDFNSGGNFMGNSDFNSGGNFMGNSDFNSGGDYMGNPGDRMDQNFGGDVSRRTVTVQSKMNYDHKPAMFDRGYNNNDFQTNSNLSEAQNRDYNPAVMNYEQNQDQYNDKGTLSFKPNQDVEMNRSSNYRAEQSDRVYSIIQKMKICLNDKPFSISNAAWLFVNVANAASASFDLNHIPPDSNTSKHRFNILVENVFLAFGTSLPSNISSTSAKKHARKAAYLNALNRLKNSSAEEICSGSAGKPAAEVNTLVHNAVIEPDPMRPISALVIRETEKTCNNRVKNAMRILRSSAFFSKMSVDTAKSEVGNLHKVTVFVQNKPVGIGLGSSMTTAMANAAADALFNNFYRKCPIIHIHEEEYSQTWINWTNVKYLANEMESIGGRSFGFGQNLSNRSFAIAIKKLVDSHSWNEVNNELVFGPGMSDDCAISLANIAKERNLKLEIRKHSQFGNYYLLRRHYDPLDLVNCLKRNGGRKGKYRLVNKSEIPEIKCDYWEPSSSVWNDNKVPASKGFNLNKQKTSDFPKRETSDRNVGASSIQPARDTFSNKRRMAIDDQQAFPLFDYKTDEFDVLPHSKNKYLMQDNQKFTQDDGEFRQVSRSNSDFRPMSDSFDREPKQMSWADDRGFGQMSQPNEKEYGQRHQPNSDEFGKSRWLDNSEIRQMRRSEEFGQMSRSDDREFRPVSQTNIDEPNQTTWRDRMPGSYDRETSRSDTREFGAMQSLERELQLRGQMERGGMSENFDKEFNSDKNLRLGHDEKRHDYIGQNFNRISNDQDREFNSQFRTNEGNREQINRSYGDNYKNLPDFNDERIGRHTYENKLDKMSVPSDIGINRSSTYDKRFNFDKPTSEPDNRQYNQLMGSNKRDYDNVSGFDSNRLCSQGPNFDDRRLRFNDEPQLSSVDRRNNQIKPNNMMDTNRMQNNGPWNNMQNSRNDDRKMANNSRMFPPNKPVPPQRNMMMQQNMMAISQNLNKNQITALRFLTQKIAHTALHANVKNILENAQRLSIIASARNMMEKSAPQAALFTGRTQGKGVRNRPLPGTNQKPARMLQHTQKKKTDEKPSNYKKSSNQKVFSQNKK